MKKWSSFSSLFINPYDRPHFEDFTGLQWSPTVESDRDQI